MERRFFLSCSGAIALLSAIPGYVWALFLKNFPIRTVEIDDFRFDPVAGTIRWTGKKGVEPYVLTIDGLVGKPLKLPYNTLLSLPQTTQASDFHCVEGWSVADVRWAGFRFDEIVKRVGPRADAKYVILHSLGETEDKPGGQGHYIESFRVSDLIDPRKECLLALSMDRKPLTHDHGAPLRLVSPYDLGYKNIKYVTRIEFVREFNPGWWTLANPIYPINAPVPAGRLRKK